MADPPTASTFDPDETLPLPSNDTKTDESKRLLSLLNDPIDEATSASLLSHLSSLQEGPWDDLSCQFATACIRLAIRDVSDPVLARRLLTDGILPLASASPVSSTCTDHGDSLADSYIRRIVRFAVDELLSSALLDASNHAQVEIMDTTMATNINEGIKILLPAFLHRLDSDEASSRSLSSIGDETLDKVIPSVDDILDKFCGLSEQCKLHAHVTAGLLSAIKEFDSLSGSTSGRISKKRIWQTTKTTYGRDYTFEYVDRPTSLIKMAISSLEALARSKEHDALPPLVYQLAILPMGLLRGDAKVKIKGENEKQRGMRLRKMVLDGIAVALEDASLGLGGAAGTDDDTQKANQVAARASNAQSDEWRWSRYTSLSHMGTCLRMDPEMSKAVLAMLGGKISTRDNSGYVAPFQYQRLTPFKLAMGLSMASSVPRMRQSALGCVRDLILEEETIRIRCGIGRCGKRVGLGKPWMLCLVRCLEKVSSGDEKAWDEFQLENEDGQIGHVMKCLVMVAKFAETSEAGGGAGGISAGSASMILQSLVTLGFLLIDSVKKDEKSKSSVVPSSALLGGSLDVSILTGSSGSCVEDTSANHATASTGRMLLSYLFYQSAASSSHFVTSSLSRSSNEGGTSLCRLILKSCIDKLCGMAPNALQYGKVLTDLLQFSPVVLKSITQDLEVDSDGLDDRQKEEVISLAMATHHIPMLIDTLSNVPGGGMSPDVAIQAVIPAIGNLLLLQASAGSLRPGLAGYLWKKNDIFDHVDHGYLLAKKSLFCIDEDKRKCAAKMLVSLIGTAVIASSGGNKRTASKWAPALDEMRSSLRRCLTQHQQSVRMEVYSSLMAILPDDTSSSAATQTQESVSPKSQSPNQRSSHSTQSFIPPAAREDLADMTCRILLSQLDRYISTPAEQIQDKRARQQRGHVIGSQLSQIADVEQTQENESSMPLRFEMLVSTRPAQIDKSQGKSKKSTPIAQTLLNEALSRINEPLGFLIASCNAACSDAGSIDSDITDDNHQAELQESLKHLRRRMAGCNDIEEYLKWLKSNKAIFAHTNNATRKEEMAIGKLASLIAVAVAAETLLGTCIQREVPDGFIGVDTTHEELENLFNLRQDAVSRASEIMSSFSSSKPKGKKLKEKDANADNESEPRKKKSKRANEGDDEGVGNQEDCFVTTTDINRAMQAKNQKLLEDAIDNITPGLPFEFLVSVLRKFGTKAEKELNDNAEESDDEGAIATRLTSCQIFRRFIITKSTLLVGGAKIAVKAGYPFVSLRENVNGLIASSLSIGQQLFAEFCAHSNEIVRTSLEADHELPLAQISLRGFSLCVSGMAADAPHSMTRAGRVSAIIRLAKMAASAAVPSSKDSWEYYNKLNVDDSAYKSAPPEELTLKRALLPFISQDSSNRVCLFEELLVQSMQGEAMECSNVILAAASAFTDANLKEHFACTMLKCYGKRGDEVVGVLGLDFGDESVDNTTCLAHVVDIGFRLSHYLDGDTHAPLPSRFLASKEFKGALEERIRLSRSKVGLSTTNIQNWPMNHHERLREELSAPEGCGIGIVQQVSWALTVNLGHNCHFDNTFGPESSSKGALKLPCIKTVSKTAQSNFDREKTSIGQTIITSIQSGLDNAEYATLKLIPNLSDESLDLAQSFVACSLLTVSKVISASAPSADSVDKGSFASSLLKNTKRLYSNLARFISSYTVNPKSITSKETKAMLDYIKSTLVPRIVALLLVLQEKQETAEGKYLAESKIESHGRTAAALVFEKEKLDNALLKMVTILKQAGRKEESEWLGKHVVTSTNTDFRIRDITEAKEREAAKKVSGSKRKKKDQSEEKSKKVKVKKEFYGDVSMDAEEEDCSDEEEVVTCEVVASTDEEDNDSENVSEDEESDQEAEFDE